MKPGDLAPNFTLPDQTGKERALREFLDTGPVVLFFYPAAMTPGCTAESCHFRDLAAEFAEVGAHRVGISPDQVDKQAKFATVNAFDYPLLSDPDGAVATAFGVRRRFGPLLTKRKTFVIDTDGAILEAIKSEFRFTVHADRALEVLRNRENPAA
ncbi:peroxiredoxin [Actinokineospora iranica]|uniref:thioredoxin-dependent peroxiredoxin n=1 Tax=Actinokineospora iranica TaxID=1271860 RepID=A0A1G6J6E0_9PSEU|nr:peroxiredoxin [Actinokineospora iranica]SDC14153.1 peroxiredoxin Q/BCP [Actinokineospora iranica]